MKYAGRYIARRKLWVLLVVLPNVLLILRSTLDRTSTIRETESNTEGVKSWNISNSKTVRLNVIILTHMSSGSTFLGNLFNLHPDVFYLYEPLNELRMVVYGDRNVGEWSPLGNKTQRESYRNDVSNLLRDFFTCSFQENKTVNYLFPDFLREKELEGYLAWSNKSTDFTKELLREVCNSRQVTVAKIMQTRLPGEIGIRELQRVCSSEPDQFECLIIHLVRDPRAVVSSLILNKFHIPVISASDPKKRLRVAFSKKPTLGKEAITNNTHILCSVLEVNLNYVNEEWSNWFKSRYILMRYEDTSGDLLATVSRIYKFTGLPMIPSIRKWILEGKRPTGVTNRNPAFFISKNDTDKISKWRVHLNISQVSEFEEVCWPLMYMMGYISVNGSGTLLNDTSQNLCTTKIPFPFPQSE